MVAAKSPELLSAVRKVSWRLLPFLVLMYIIAFIDRVNIGYAKSVLQADTGFSDAAFALGAGIFFIGYAAAELPSNLIMQKVGARAWMARIMISWGVLSILMMFAWNEAAFYTIRFLLGVAEAGFFPGVLLYMTYWFPDFFRARAVGIFYFAIPIALAFGSGISGLLLGMDGLQDLTGWQWMFLVQGGLAVLIGIWAYFYLTNTPDKAQWLTATQRTALTDELDREEASKSHSSGSSSGKLGKLLTDPVVLIYALVFFCIQIAVYGVIFYLPSIVQDIMGDASQLAIGTVGAIPWLLSIVGCYMIARWADRSSKPRRLVIISFVLMGIGLATSLFLPPILTLIALTIAAATYMGATPVFWTIPSRYLSRSATAGGLAVITALGNIGGFVSPVLKTWVEETTGVQALGMATMGFFALVAALILWLVRRHDDLHSSKAKTDSPGTAANIS